MPVTINRSVLLKELKSFDLSSLKSQALEEAKAQMNEIKKFETIKDASKELNISLSCIKDVLKEKQKSSKGFIFKYLE